MKRPAFTREQLAYLRALLTPSCCHVSGMHDPTHSQRYVCDIQKREAFDIARKRLGFRAVRPGDVVSKLACYWCEGGRDRAKGKG